MVEVVFKYRDEQSGWQWREQSCVMESVAKCIEWYGLGKDGDYEIVSVKPVNE